MKKTSYLFAALAAIAITAPSIANAQEKPMIKEGMSKPMHHHHMMRHHHMMHHHMKKMMKKDDM